MVLFFQLAMSVVYPNNLVCVWGIFKSGSITAKLENVSLLFMVVAKEMPTTLRQRRSVKRLVQVIKPLTFQINSTMYNVLSPV